MSQETEIITLPPFTYCEIKIITELRITKIAGTDIFIYFPEAYTIIKLKIFKKECIESSPGLLLIKPVTYSGVK